MKITRRLFAMTLALILTVALATTAFAETAVGTITITGESTTEYSVYKMFNVMSTEGGYIYTMTED